MHGQKNIKLYQLSWADFFCITVYAVSVHWNCDPVSIGKYVRVILINKRKVETTFLLM